MYLQVAPPYLADEALSRAYLIVSRDYILYVTMTIMCYILFDIPLHAARGAMAAAPPTAVGFFNMTIILSTDRHYRS